MRLRLFDYISFAVAVVVIVAFSLHAYRGGEQGAQVRVQSEAGVFLYPLEGRRSLSVAGPLGETEILISSGGVEVLDSPCRDKICIAAGKATMSGEWIACLPNRVFIRVEGVEDTPVDAQTF